MTDNEIQILIDRGNTEEKAVKRRAMWLACWKLFVLSVLIACALWWMR